MSGKAPMLVGGSGAQTENATPNMTDLARLAHRLADAARAVALPHFRRPSLVADNKEAAGFDPVTVADRDCEARIREILAEERPDDAILGEEFGPAPGTSGLTWIIDPVDGTRAFIAGAPTWGVLIALASDAGPVFGIIDQPYTRERFSGGFGAARFAGPHGGGAMATRKGRGLGEAVLLTTYPEIGSPAECAAFARVAGGVRLVRYGLDCYAYGLLALGQVDLVIEAGLQSYDIAAPIAVVQAAGGVVTDWQGGPAHGGGQVIAAGSAELHAAALERLQAG